MSYRNDRAEQVQVGTAGEMTEALQWTERDARTWVYTYVLNALGKAVVADVALSFILLRAIKPHYAFMDEPA